MTGRFPAGALLPVLFVCCLCCAAAAKPATGKTSAVPAAAEPALPVPHPAAELDEVLRRAWSAAGLSAVPRASDAVFLRRICFDVIGRPPTVAETRRFLSDSSPAKRIRLIDRLLASPECDRLLAMRFADLLRVKSEFPINLWPNAVQCYHRYLLDAVRRDRPLTEVARELLTVDGSNFRVAPANFFRASADRSPKGLGEVVALTFLGMRTARWSAADRESFALFFSRIRFKSTDEWKEEIVYNDPQPVRFAARTPDGRVFKIDTAAADPRVVFADWLLDEKNPFFARAAVNRLWAWIFGRGIADPADDLRPPVGFWGKIAGSDPGPQPVIPELAGFLETEFRRGGCRIKPLLRTILDSAAYQADWNTLPGERERAARLFAVYPVRRLEAELVIDAVAAVTGEYERYRSVIPEPFTFLPRGFPATGIADGSISSANLDNFGRPPRDSGLLGERNNTINAKQRLWLMNSGVLYRGCSRAVVEARRQNPAMWKKDPVGLLYLHVLSRPPTEHDRAVFRKYVAGKPRSRQHAAYGELVWALVNTREFLYHH